MQQEPKTIAELMATLPEQVLEHDRQQLARWRENAQRMHALFADLKKRGIHLYDLPRQAQDLIWILDSGEPIHPRDSEYLKGAIRDASKAG